VTNVGLDHMNYYHTEKELMGAFRKYFSQVRSTDHLFWCGDDHRLKQLSPEGVSYGFSECCQLKGSNFRQEGWKSLVNVTFKGRQYADIEIALAGRHNVLNAMAVFGLALSVGVGEPQIRAALKTFNGVARRCERKGEKRGILFLDDYAHHPTEIQATLSAIRDANPMRRLVAVFQPHRYSRTKDCMGLFGTIFNAVDQVILTDIHAAGEQPIEGVEVKYILEEIKQGSTASCRYLPRKGLADTLSDVLKKGDVVVTLGAGNITKVGSVTLELLVDESEASV